MNYADSLWSVVDFFTFMNFSSPLCRNWILVAIIVISLSLFGQAQQPLPGEPPQPPTSQNPAVPGQEAQPPAAGQPTPTAPRPSPIVRQIEIQYAGPATLSRQRI